MNNIKSIHQFTPSLALGDSISNSLLYTQKLLKELGFISKIYIARYDIDYKFKHDIYHINEYVQSQNQLLFYHHSIGDELHDLIMQFLDKKILIYHNITPPHFFKDNSYIQKLCILGREQLAASAKCFFASVGVSRYNCKELEYYNYPNPAVLTLLVDLDKQAKHKVNEKLVDKYHDIYNILFVGRILSSKAQHQLVDVMFALKQKGIKNFKLHIVGGTFQDDYLNFLKNYIKNLDILAEVTIVGKVNDEDLAAYYNLADLYLSLSDHEGFGMPLIEAMKYDIPVLAFNAGGVSTTIPKEGLLENKAPSFIADKIIELQNDPYFRVNLIKKQKKHLEKFSYQNCIKNLSKYLNSLDIQTQNINPKIDSSIEVSNYQIEGPFDSTYSLALVNKNVALSLDKLDNTNVKLYSTEGTGNFEANFETLDEDVKILSNKDFQSVDITIRNLYPPRTNAMQGYHKIIGPYGWEESKFPQQYVEWFNTKTTLLLAMSDYVKNLLQDNGVYIPIKTTGIIVEDILHIKTKSLNYKLPNGFKLLHISSCFARKGVDVLLEAYDSLDKNISLIIKTFPNPHNNILDQFSELNYKLELTYEENVFLYKKNNKEILLINKDIEQSQIKYLYENANLLVAPSFGEGFGLPMAEAMLFDLPVVTTSYGGQNDFCTSQTSWLIDFDFKYAQTHMNLENSLWAVPKVSSLKQLIYKIFNLKSDEISLKTKKAKQYILNNYSSKKVSQNIQECIRNYPLQKPRYNIGLISTYNTKCGIADYAKHLISTFEDEVSIFAPTTKQKLTAEDTQNIIRCWNYGRKTISIQNLKQNIIDKNITQLVIQYNFGFFSLDILEELIKFCFINDISTHLFLHSTQDIQTDEETISFSQIKKSMNKVTKIYIHSLSDINYLKDIGIFKNTYLFIHAIDDTLIQKKENYFNNLVDNQEITLATFGYLLPQKGILELIDILELLHTKGIKAKLLLLNALYPAPESKELEKELKEKIYSSTIKNYITLNTRYLTPKDIVFKLSKATKIIYYYKHTQESSSAAIRMGLLAQKEVITTPNKIFDDIKSILTQSQNITIESITKEIISSLKKPYDLKKHKEFIVQNSWTKISNKFKNSLIH